MMVTTLADEIERMGVKSENKKRINSKTGRVAMMLFGRCRVKVKEGR